MNLQRYEILMEEVHRKLLIMVVADHGGLALEGKLVVSSVHWEWADSQGFGGACRSIHHMS